MFQIKAAHIAAGLMLLFAPAALQAQEEAVPWLDNYKQALEEARRTQKPIFLEYRCEP